MKVAIASCYYNHNYGSMLQAYATQEAIKRLGCDTKTLRCLSPIHYMTQSKFRYYFHKVTNKDILSRKIREYKGKQNLKKYPEIQKNIEIRNECFDNFYKSSFDLTELLSTRDEMHQYVSQVDAVVVGSDQLWNPVNVEHDFFTLTFVPDDVNMIAYATSIGTTNIPDYQTETYRNFLSRFDSIAVREKSAVDVIKKLGISKDVAQVLDPTLLLTGDEWLGIQQKEAIVKEKYILCYYLGVNQDHRKFAEKVKRLTGLEIVTLPHLDEFVEKDINFGDKQLFDIGPAEFVNLIRNAELVLTDSFHGSCFSILNHKKFITLNRFSNANSESTNTRLDSLLSMLGLLDRRCNGSENDESIRSMLESDIDYEKVDRELQALRQDSITYLSNALGLEKEKKQND